VTGGNLDIAQVDAGIEHGRHEGVTEHVRVCPGDLEAGGRGEVPQAAGGGVPVHPGAAAVEQDRRVPVGDLVRVAGGGVSGRSDQMQQCINIRFAACLPSGSRDRRRCERARDNRTPARLIG
jgi:hypothetical protein